MGLPSTLDIFSYYLEIILLSIKIASLHCSVFCSAAELCHTDRDVSVFQPTLIDIYGMDKIIETPVNTMPYSSNGSFQSDHTVEATPF